MAYQQRTSTAAVPGTGSWSQLEYPCNIVEKSKLEYLQASVIVSTAKRISLPELLVKHAADFVVTTADDGGRSTGETGQLGYLVKWVCNQLPTSGSLRKPMVDCFKNQNTKASSSSLVVEKILYDFEFQYLLAI